MTDHYDVIVVGYGLAGVSAAIEAADRGASVLVLDRAYGGGASALSGGVVYAGGGTAQQAEAGVEDSVENLYNYLRLETGDAVDDETLRAFCEHSPGTIPWLEEQGATFAGSLAPYKTSYPTDRHYLYYSGNEKAHPYKDSATPAPRGHRTVAKGLASGKVLWNHLADSARRKGVTFLPLARVEKLIMEGKSVVGVEYRVLDSSHPSAAKHKKLTKRSAKLGNWAPDLVAGTTKKIEAIWQAGATTRVAHGSGVILGAGGFIYNSEWVARHAPEFTKISPLGTPADDGVGIRLGLDAGGTVDKMGNVTAWRFLSPPSAFIEGITVGPDGTRIANEDLYGATHGNVMMREHGGEGYAIYDSLSWKKARSQVKTQTTSFQKLQAFYLFWSGRKKANTLDALADKLGIDRDGLTASVQAYNTGIASGEGDPARKDPELCMPISTPPYWGYSISVDASPFYPVPGLTLGGLLVDGATGAVVHKDGGVVPGLYAAGRNAVGVCSNGYISGLSLADCVFSGRRAATAVMVSNKK